MNGWAGFWISIALIEVAAIWYQYKRLELRTRVTGKFKENFFERFF